MALKPWRNVVDPREDLRRGDSLDAAEFAVHLDEVNEGRGNADYYRPEQFFARTYLTRHLLDLSAQVVRRLSGKLEGTSAVYNMTTQFGGGKTHALTLLYHLARHGPAALPWTGVATIRDHAGTATLPQARTAVFVGHQFDPRGGDDGTPLRRTPWGEIAWQLAGEPGYALMAATDSAGSAPGGDTLGRLFDLVDEPVLILMDEVINYISRHRADGLGGQFYNFVHSLTEEATARSNVVVAVSIPKSVEEMTTDDEGDYTRFSKLLNRLGQAVVMSAENDTAEIIRRRLFDWDPRAVDQRGKVILPREAIETCQAYAAWVQTHRGLLPGWFAADNALDEFKATYPFHPALISVFQRKWATLRSFQRTRGVLRLLGTWVSRVHQDAYKSAHNDPLIGLGTAPLEDAWFRSAIFKQLGDDELEAAVTTDIAGTHNAHAARLDADSNEVIKRARLHRKVATSIFFESNGGTTRNYATVPEIRLAVGEPDLDISNVETALEALAPPNGACFYLDVRGTHYFFSRTPNLTKIFADRRMTLAGDPGIEETVRAEVQRQFGSGGGVNRVFFPEGSNEIPNQPALTVVVWPPEPSTDLDAAYRQMQKMTQEHGNSARTYKSAVIWVLPGNAGVLFEAAQKWLAWDSLWDDRGNYPLSKGQIDQLGANRTRAKSDLEEAVWRVYNKVTFLDRDNRLRHPPLDLGQQNSSSAADLLTLVIRELRKGDEVVTDVSPNLLARNWPPAFVEWSTRAVRDVFYASPQFPRLLSPAGIRETIAKGVSNGILGYVGMAAEGRYEPFYFKRPFNAGDVEITDDMYIITKEIAEAYEKKISEPPPPPPPDDGPTSPDEGAAAGEGGTRSDSPLPKPEPPKPEPAAITRLVWSGEIPPQKWSNYYMKVLTRFVSHNEVKLTLQVEIRNSAGISAHQVEEMKAALRELGVGDGVETD